MKLLVIDNYDSFTWNLVHYLEEIYEGEITVWRNDGFEPASVLEFDHLVLSPGPGLPAESGQLMQVIDVAAGKIPVFGVCLGLQAITEYFGGRLMQLPEVIHGLQRPCRILKKDILFKGITNPFLSGRYHSWAADTDQLPPCLEVLAVDDQNIIMALKHKEYPVYAVQFHPESIMTPDGMKILRNWFECVKI